MTIGSRKEHSVFWKEQNILENKNHREFTILSVMASSPEFVVTHHMEVYPSVDMSGDDRYLDCSALASRGRTLAVRTTVRGFGPTFALSRRAKENELVWITLEGKNCDDNDDFFISAATGLFVVSDGRKSVSFVAVADAELIAPRPLAPSPIKAQTIQHAGLTMIRALACSKNGRVLAVLGNVIVDDASGGVHVFASGVVVFRRDVHGVWIADRLGVFSDQELKGVAFVEEKEPIGLVMLSRKNAGEMSHVDLEDKDWVHVVSATCWHPKTPSFKTARTLASGLAHVVFPRPWSLTCRLVQDTSVANQWLLFVTVGIFQPESGAVLRTRLVNGVLETRPILVWGSGEDLPSCIRLPDRATVMDVASYGPGGFAVLMIAPAMHLGARAGDFTPRTGQVMLVEHGDEAKMDRMSNARCVWIQAVYYARMARQIAQLQNAQLQMLKKLRRR